MFYECNKCGKPHELNDPRYEEHLVHAKNAGTVAIGPLDITGPELTQPSRVFLPPSPDDEEGVDSTQAVRAVKNRRVEDSTKLGVLRRVESWLQHASLCEPPHGSMPCGKLVLELYQSGWDDLRNRPLFRVIVQEEAGPEEY